jgi:23S rRNA (adenine1618-N6)-methyltransferase
MNSGFIMALKKREHPKEKTSLHPRNRHRERYDFKTLIQSCPELAPFVKLNAYNDESVDFFDPEAVLTLNKALLMHYYGIEKWSIPDGYLCPAIPGRADYIHNMADLAGKFNNGKIPKGSTFRCLDIGVGANCVYPIIGISEYGWSFTGSDTDPVGLQAAATIIDSNPVLKGKAELRLQTNHSDIFKGIIKTGEQFDITICNPPFHASAAEARSGTVRKLSNLSRKIQNTPLLNFGGQSNELWCEGGEQKFVQQMIRQSKLFGASCLWFSTLISKEANLGSAYNELYKVEATDVKTIPMGQGNKISRILAWTFLTKEQQNDWVSKRWSNTVRKTD